VEEGERLRVRVAGGRLAVRVDRDTDEPGTEDRSTDEEGTA